jgi:RNA polymerase sigma-70 factor (ECF subfamily)
MLVESETIKKAQSGDDKAFNEIIKAYRKRILGVVYRMIGNGDDVEDVGQEVFIRLYFALGQLREPKVFEPWLYRLAKNTCYDYLRKKRRHNEVRMGDLSEGQADVVEKILAGKKSLDDDQKEEAKELVNILFSRVDEEDRILLSLKEIQGLSLKELSDVYKINTNALKVRLFRARKRMLRVYEELMGEMEPAQATEEE